MPSVPASKLVGGYAAIDLQVFISMGGGANNVVYDTYPATWSTTLAAVIVGLAKQLGLVRTLRVRVCAVHVRVRALLGPSAPAVVLPVPCHHAHCPLWLTVCRMVWTSTSRTDQGTW